MSNHRTTTAGRRFIVSEVSGYGARLTDGIIEPHHQPPTELASSSVRRRIATMRAWANGVYDTVSDTTDSDGVRIVTARHYGRGVEYVNRLIIKPTTTTNNK